MKNKKLITVLCLTLVSMLLFSACVKNEDTSSSDNNRSVTENTKTGDTGNETGDGPVLKEKITLKIFAPFSADVDPEKPFLKKLEELTNVHLEFELYPSGAEGAERFAAAMAAKEEYDLITHLNMNEINKYGQEGAFLPLQDLINKYAPNIKKGLENPLPGNELPYQMNWLAEVTAPDGNVYNVPAFSVINAVGRVYAIRDDWLKNLNLNVPETTDDLYNVLKAFKENDPNGNGQPDEIPMVAKNTNFANIAPLINGFGAHMGLYVDPADDTIKFGPVEQVWKEGMTYINKLFKEGLIDSDYLSSKSDVWLAMMSSNRAGMMIEWPMSGIGNANNELAKIDPSYCFVPMLPLKAPDGRRYTDSSTTGAILLPRTAVGISNKHVEETMKYLDFFYTEEGIKLSSYGVEGLHYNMVDGKPKYTEIITHDPDGLSPNQARTKNLINFYALPYVLGWDNQIQAMEGPSPIVVASWKLYRQPGIIESRMPTLHFTEDETEKGPMVMDEIIKYVNEKYNPFIVGEEPLDKFDDFVSQIKRMGLDEALKIYNDAYKRYSNFGK